MNRHVERYLDQFRTELKGCDRALVQDALADAEDHLASSLESMLAAHPEMPPAEAFQAVIASYGTPGEVAENYRRVEKYTGPVLSGAGRRGERTFLQKFAGVIGEPSAWAAFLYMIISMVTGTLYFVWVANGLSLSFGLLVLIIGVPVAWLFFLSFRGIALVEGRMVEALLGVRMPRRAVLIRKGPGWWGTIKGVFTTRSTWTSVLYLMLMLPLGVIYFSVFVTLTSFSLSLVAGPIAQLTLNRAVINGPDGWWIPVWLFPVVMAAGVAAFMGTLHLARLMGRLHGKMARAMLVS